MSKLKRPQDGSGLSGEGVFVEAHNLRLADEQGRGVTANFDMASVPVPTQKFVADSAGLIEVADGIKLFFLQSTLKGATRAAIDVFLARPSWINFAGSLGVFTNPEEYAGNLVPVPADEPKDALSLYASFIRTSVGPAGGVFDFLYASPFSLNYLSQTKSGVYLESVVRVMVPPKVGFALVAAAQAYQSTEPSEPIV